MLRDHVLNLITKEWIGVASQPTWNPIMGEPPNDMTIFEHLKADFEKGDCKGNGTALQTLDRDGASHPPLSTDPRALITTYRKAYWEHAVARFCISPESDRAVMEIIFGPRYGRGTFFVVREGKIEPQTAWIS